MAQFVYTMSRVGKVVPPKREILKDISLSFFPGAKIGVLGLNGAGKSTLLRIMAGRDTEFNGEARAQADINIGYLPQEPELDEELDVRGNVELGLGEIIDLVNEFNAISDKFAEPMSDDEMNALLEQIVRLVRVVAGGGVEHRVLGAVRGRFDFDPHVQRGASAGVVEQQAALAGDAELLVELGSGGVLGPHLLSGAAVDWLVARQATCVLWNSVPGDWLHADGWVDTALSQVRDLDHAVVVLHDFLPAPMAHLDRFLGALVDQGHTFTSAWPRDCLPLIEGEHQPGLSACVTPSPREASP